MDERILAHHPQPSPTDQKDKVKEERDCFYCLEGWMFLGSLDHDGEEVYEAIRCRRCKGTARIKPLRVRVMGPANVPSEAVR